MNRITRCPPRSLSASSPARQVVVASAFASAVVAAFGCTLTLGSPAARAAGPAAAASAGGESADALYEEGRKAASDKNWTLACTKFRASQAVEPAPGTQLNLGDCEENLGQLVQAEADFAAAAKAFRSGDSRAAYAKKRAQALDARVAHLSLHFVAGTPADASVERDGAVVDAATLGTSVAVDPGAHVVIVHAGGRTDVRSDIILAEGQSTVLALAAGVAAPVVAPAAASGAVASNSAVAKPAPVVAPPSPSPAPSPAPPPDAPVANRPLVGVGVAMAAVGGAGVVFGLIAGAVTLSKKSTVDADCPSTCTSQEGLDAQSSGKTWSTISTVSVIAGAAVGGTGLALVLFNLQPSAPSSGASASASRITFGPTPGAGGGQLGWSGSF